MDDYKFLTARYKIGKELGRGGFGVTYLAFDNQENKQCVIKHILLTKAEAEKSFDLVKHESKIMENINHPRIPKFIDFFTLESEAEINMYIVQEYIAGKNLAQTILEGRHFVEKEVLRIALNLVKILEYIHSFSPPIIHRDIKPENIILTDDNMVYLIDFGAVKEKLLSGRMGEMGVSTIIGTQGYIPIEQFEGRAIPASDIYALGLTLIYLLSHKDIYKMEKDGLSLDFKPHINVSENFELILEKMIAPDSKKRYKSATELKEDILTLLSNKVISTRKISIDKPLSTKSREDLRIIESQLYEGEKLLWFDKPNVKQILYKQITILLFILGLTITPVSIFFTILTYFLMILWVFLIPLIATGIGLISYPFLIYKNSKKTIYAITNRRIIVVVNHEKKMSPISDPGISDFAGIIKLPLNKVFSRNNSYSKEALKNMFIEKREYADGSGDIIFFTNTYDNRNKYVKTIHLQLQAIPEVHKVEKIILETFKS